MTEYLSVSAARLDDIKAHTETDNELQMVMEVVKSGWPKERKKLPVRCEINLLRKMSYCM